jgi:hypothetical protein
MTREREFLKNLRYATHLENDLRKELKELLAQPEQDQEPVAWMYEWVDEVGEPVKSVVYNFYEDANLIPLYTAPPKRKPLNIEEIHNGLDGNNGYDDRFVDGVRFAEKEHGIGE